MTFKIRHKSAFVKFMVIPSYLKVLDYIKNWKVLRFLLYGKYS